MSILGKLKTLFLRQRRRAQPQPRPAPARVAGREIFVHKPKVYTPRGEVYQQTVYDPPIVCKQDDVLMQSLSFDLPTVSEPVQGGGGTFGGAGASGSWDSPSADSPSSDSSSSSSSGSDV